jgi:hypothetical protein
LISGAGTCTAAARAISGGGGGGGGFGRSFVRPRSPVDRGRSRCSSRDGLVASITGRDSA